MPCPVSPVDRILVQVEQKYSDEIVTESGIKFYKDVSFNPAWNVTVTGKVVSVPAKLSQTEAAQDGSFVPDRFRSRLHAEVKEGDELFFSYAVIEDKDVKKDSDAFTEQTAEHAANRVWTNGKKETLQVKLLTKKIAVAMWKDANDELIAGTQGTPKECEKWLSQFRFDQDGETIYRNLLWTEEGEYWMVDYLEAIAVKRGEDIIMLNGMVLCEAQLLETEYKISGNGDLYHAPILPNGELKVVAVGKPLKDEPELGIKTGDKIKVIQSHVQQYELWGEKYTLIDQRSILGKL